MKSNKKLHKDRENLKRWREQAKGMDLRQLHWQYADSVRQASYYHGSGTQTEEFYAKRADFYLDLFQKGRNKEQKKMERKIQAAKQAEVKQ